MMAYCLQQIANAVPVAALYAALAFGYSLAFAMTRRADLVYGALFAFAGQIFLLFTGYGWSQFYLVLPAALAFGAASAAAYAVIAGIWVGRTVMLPLHRAAPNTLIVASLAVLVVIAETGRLALDSRGLWLPNFLGHRIVFLAIDGFEVSLTVIQIVNSALMLLLVLVGQIVLKRGRAGRVWRAVCDDPRAAALCGVDAGRAFILAYATASAIAALCGILATSYYGTMDFGAGLMFGLKVILIAAAGGHGNPGGSAAGAAAIGAAETFWNGYGPILWRDPVIISVLVVFLVMSRRERIVP